MGEYSGDISFMHTGRLFAGVSSSGYIVCSGTIDAACKGSMNLVNGVELAFEYSDSTSEIVYSNGEKWAKKIQSPVPTPAPPAPLVGDGAASSDSSLVEEQDLQASNETASNDTQAAIDWEAIQQEVQKAVARAKAEVAKNNAKRPPPPKKGGK